MNSNIDLFKYRWIWHQYINTYAGIGLTVNGNEWHWRHTVNQISTFYITLAMTGENLSKLAKIMTRSHFSCFSPGHVCFIYSQSLSLNPLQPIISYTLNIHLTLLMSARWNINSFLTSLSQYFLSRGISCLSLFHPFCTLPPQLCEFFIYVQQVNKGNIVKPQTV